MGAKSTGLTEAGSVKINEDVLYSDDALGLYVMCDGIGGNGIGAVASRIAVDSVRSFFMRHQPEVNANRDGASKEQRLAIRSLLEAATLEASKAIFEAAHNDPAKRGMCTTVDLLFVAGVHLVLAHVGSGRVSLIRSGESHQLTEDHTQLAHLRRIGKATVNAADAMVLSKRLTKVVGFQPTVKPDLLEVELQTGDQIFACTDGVWLALPEDKLESLVTNHNVGEAVTEIKEEVLRTGAKDNFTLAFVTPRISAAADSGTSAGMKVQLTGRVPVFEFLSYSEVIQVLSVAELFKVQQGHVICKEGDLGAEMMLVIEGSVDVQKTGKRLATLNKGDFFGETSILGTAPRSATIVARENTNLLAFPRETLFELLRQEQGICVKFLWGISQELNKRLRVTSSQLVGQTPATSPEKLKTSQLPFLYSQQK